MKERHRIRRQSYHRKRKEMGLCLADGCPEKVGGGYCIKHQQARAERSRLAKEMRDAKAGERLNLDAPGCRKAIAAMDMDAIRSLVSQKMSLQTVFARCVCNPRSCPIGWDECWNEADAPLRVHGSTGKIYCLFHNILYALAGQGNLKGGQ